MFAYKQRQLLRQPTTRMKCKFSYKHTQILTFPKLLTNRKYTVKLF